MIRRLLRDSYLCMVNAWLITFGALLGWGTALLGGDTPPYGPIVVALLFTGWHYLYSRRQARNVVPRVDPGLGLVRQPDRLPTPQGE